MGNNEGSIPIPRVWRSEIGGLVFLAVAALVAIGLTKQFPGSILVGELFSLGFSVVYLKLPLFFLIPAICWINLLFRIYNVRYSADTRGIQAVVGILSLNQRIIRVRYEDVRSIETDQTVIERLLDVGDVEIGTAGTAGVELTLAGIGAPKEVQEMIQAERDKRQRLGQRGGNQAALGG
jgi:uncharacterized membrane protein YdbT with pleckstrin-like domain